LPARGDQHSESVAMTRRTERVAEAVQELVAELLLREIKDPRIGLVTITGVKVSPDLRHARIYFSCLGDDTERAQTLRGLTSAAGFVRSQVARRLNLRVAPEIVFEFDASLEQAERMARLLKSLPGDSES
jgi:ribosome-binding factor A